MKNKNYAIEFYRILATLVICIHHIQEKCGLGIFTNGDLCVDFFFILSGIFIANSFVKEKEHSGSRYFIQRVKRLYPEYLWAAIVAIVLYGIIGKFKISKALPELFMVQNIGMFEGGYNYPCWYVSTLMFASFVVYELLKYREGLFVKIISPLVVVAGYSYIFVNWTDEFIWSNQGCIYVPMLRCLCGLSMGVFILYVSRCSFVKSINRIWGTIAEFACLAVISTGLVTNIFSEAVIVSAFAVLAFLTYSQCGILGGKLFNFKGFGYVSAYSYSVYLNHGIMANVLDTLNNSFLHIGKSLIIVYLLAVIVYSIITHKVISLVCKRIEKRKMA